MNFLKIIVFLSCLIQARATGNKPSISLSNSNKQPLVSNEVKNMQEGTDVFILCNGTDVDQSSSGSTLDESAKKAWTTALLQTQGEDKKTEHAVEPEEKTHAYIPFTLSDKITRVKCRLQVASTFDGATDSEFSDEMTIPKAAEPVKVDGGVNSGSEESNATLPKGNKATGTDDNNANIGEGENVGSSDVKTDDESVPEQNQITTRKPNDIGLDQGNTTIEKGNPTTETSVNQAANSTDEVPKTTTTPTTTTPSTTPTMANGVKTTETEIETNTETGTSKAPTFAKASMSTLVSAAVMTMVTMV